MGVEYRDLGVMKYSDCWEYQQRLFDALIEAKSRGERSSEGHLLLVEHPAVYTLGKSGNAENMLRISNPDFLASIEAEFFRTDRGGDITFHGRGQIVGYPILDLEQIGIGLRQYIDSLEEAVIALCARYGVHATRSEGASGVWINDEKGLRKVCAIGVRSSRFVTMHGFALNVSTDLRYFDYINPCGFRDRGVTSLEREVGSKISIEEVKELLINELEKKLNVKIYKN